MNIFRIGLEKLDKVKRSSVEQRKRYDGPVGKLIGQRVMQIILLNLCFILDEDDPQTLFMKSRTKIYAKINSSYQTTESRVKELLAYLHQRNSEVQLMDEIKNQIFELLSEISEDSQSMTLSSQNASMFSVSSKAGSNRLQLSSQYAPSVGTAIRGFIEAPGPAYINAPSASRSILSNADKSLQSAWSLSQSFANMNFGKKLVSTNSTIPSLSFEGDVQEYLENSVKNYKTELNYFFQHMKTQEPKFDVDQIGTDFQATCILRVPIQDGYRRNDYRDSAIASNGKNAQNQAAKKVLAKLYRENPIKWDEFLKIKAKNKLVA